MFVESWSRATPFFDKTWKEVGIATSMVYHIADEMRVGIIVMQDDILVGKHWPKNVEEAPAQWVGYNIWGKHGFFYTSEAMKHLGPMKVRPNGKKVLERHRMQLGESREHTPFADLDWYELGDVREAIAKKKAKTFQTCNIKAAQEQLREHNITFYSQYMDPPEVVKALNIHDSTKRQGRTSKQHTTSSKIIRQPDIASNTPWYVCLSARWLFVGFISGMTFTIFRKSAQKIFSNILA